MKSSKRRAWKGVFRGEELIALRVRDLTPEELNTHVALLLSLPTELDSMAGFELRGRLEVLEHGDLGFFFAETRPTIGRPTQLIYCINRTGLDEAKSVIGRVLGEDQTLSAIEPIVLNSFPDWADPGEDSKPPAAKGAPPVGQRRALKPLWVRKLSWALYSLLSHELLVDIVLPASNHEELERQSDLEDELDQVLSASGIGHLEGHGHNLVTGEDEIGLCVRKPHTTLAVSKIRATLLRHGAPLGTVIKVHGAWDTTHRVK